MAQNITLHNTPNFTKGRLSYKPEAVVIHIMEGSLTGTDDWFSSTKSQVSAHYGIGLNGDIHQYVQEADTAWHAGRVDNPSWQLIKSGKTKKFINPNFYTIGIEHEGNESSTWTDLLYNTSAALVKDICQRNNIPIDRQHIIGHHEIYSKKTCPGHVVNLDKLISIILGNTEGADNSPENIFIGSVITNGRLRIRTGNASIKAPVLRIADSGTILQYTEIVTGEKVENISDWYTDGSNAYWWAGACTKL